VDRMKAVILSIWMLNPTTHQYEFTEHGRYATPIQCAQAARDAKFPVWSCIYEHKSN